MIILRMKKIVCISKILQNYVLLFNSFCNLLKLKNAFCNNAVCKSFSSTKSLLMIHAFSIASIDNGDIEP